MTEPQAFETARFAFHILTPNGGIEPLGRDQSSWTRGLASLVDQEVVGQRRGPAHPRVQQLLGQFGFEFEPATEPGHMRFQPLAARMLQRVTTYAEVRARAIATDLEIPFDRIEGVNVIDGSAPLLQEYFRLIHAEENLYGAEPYFLAPPRAHLLLRQTACLQKFLVAREWDLTATHFPRCLYELSDSFRGEPDDDLQLSFRLRRFRLPEAHLHARSLDESVAQAERVHALISDDLARNSGEFAMLVTATHKFVRRHRGFLIRLATRARAPALLKECPPGALCEDGVEVDVEYKFVDSNGFARELSTFQIDELITCSVGVSRPGTPVTTIHIVPIGSTERFVFAAFDRIAQIEADGGRARLPLWVCPVVVRLAWEFDQAPPADVVDALCRTLEAHRLPVDIDDRPLPLAAKVDTARTELVPLVVLLNRASTPNLLRVRRFETDATLTMALQNLLSDSHLNKELDVGSLPPLPQRLSARPVFAAP